MARDPCDGCGRPVSIGGGVANLWSTDPDRTEGLTLEFEDGSDHFLCYDCIEALPEEPTAADVAALDRETETSSGDDSRDQ